MVQPTPAVCKLLEYDGATATVEVRTGTMHLPRVAVPAKTLRDEHLEPGMEFVWFITDSRPEPPPKITRDLSVLAMAKNRLDLMLSMDEEDREKAKFDRVPEDVIETGAEMFRDFALSYPNAAPLHDEAYVRLFGDLVRLLDPYDLLRKYRDALLDRMIVRGREMAWATWELKRRREKKVAQSPPPVPSYSEQWAKLSRWQRIKFRVKLAWRALFASLPPKQTKKEEDLENACHYTLAQEFDDICWLDFYLKIAKILGVEYNPKLLPRDRFLGNCGRFYDSMASGRPYERDPGKECCDGSDGTVQSGCGSQPRRPLPLRDGPEAGR